MVCVRHLASAFAIAIALTMPLCDRAQAQESTRWLFVVHGEVTRSTTADLALATGQRGIAFSDRPERIVRFVNIPALVEAAWSESGDFRANPPNASLVNESRDSVTIVTIADAAWREDRLHLSLNAIEGDMPAPGEPVALTIDESNVGYNGGTWTLLP
jgi:hypothetical protein